MVELHTNSALAHRKEPDTLAITMREMPARGMIDLRGLTSDKKFMAAAKSALGFALPTTPRTTANWGDLKCLWLSVDQWLILSPPDKAQALHQQLVAALDGIHSLVVDVSHMRSVIRIEGEHARTTLMKGTSIDLTHGDYPAGSVRRMKFAEVAALLHIVEQDVIEIYVFRSYADYVWNFLMKAGRKGAEVRLFPA
jgi:sarcosine oxidase, subunit gamma